MRVFNRLVLVAVFLVTLVALPLAPSYARSGPTGFADLAEKLLPSVVNISTTQLIPHDEAILDFDLQVPEGSPLEEFFKDFKERQGKMRPKSERKKSSKATSLGSGFIIDPAGYIVTNNHVIQDAEEITVILNDDTNLIATVVGRDKKTDLAVLKVDAKRPLPAITFGDSDKSRVGDWILAIGNPFGLGGTVTTGIISARARDINSGPYDDYIQTDAPINRGNSGGPMFNMDGEVIGVNTAIFSPTGGSIGIGFAIPSSIAKGIIDQLKTSGVTKRGWLGVRIQMVTKEIAESLGLPAAKGALVSSVNPDGPAVKAKVEPGDVIVMFDGKEVTDMHRLPRIVADTEVGKTVDMKVIRKGKEVMLKVKVAQLEADEEDEEEKLTSKKERPQAQPLGDTVAELGLAVTPITDSLRKKYGVAKDVSGVIVMDVDPDGLAAEYGLQPGDVISEAAQQPIPNAKALTDVAQRAKKDNKPVLVLVDRKGDVRFVAMNFEKIQKKSDDKTK